MSSASLCTTLFVQVTYHHTCVRTTVMLSCCSILGYFKHCIYFLFLFIDLELQQQERTDERLLPAAIRPAPPGPSHPSRPLSTRPPSPIKRCGEMALSSGGLCRAELRAQPLFRGDLEVYARGDRFCPCTAPLFSILAPPLPRASLLLYLPCMSPSPCVPTTLSLYVTLPMCSPYTLPVCHPPHVFPLHSPCMSPSPCVPPTLSLYVTLPMCSHYTLPVCHPPHVFPLHSPCMSPSPCVPPTLSLYVTLPMCSPYTLPVCHPHTPLTGVWS